MEFWLVSAPGDPSRDVARRNLTDRLRELASIYDLRIPDLKVGTLDSLVQLSDDLAKIDTFGESVANKVAQFQTDLIETSKKEIAGAMEKSETLSVNGQTLEAYVAKFQWDAQKYNAGGFVRDISGEIGQKLSGIETELKTRMQAFNKVTGNLQALERKSNGTLLIRSLHDIVKPEHFVHDSEYLVTLVVVVPRQLYVEWHDTYASLTDLVVPNSSELITDDNDYGLFSVTVFRKIAGDFRVAAQKKKFIVRDFEFVDEEVKTQRAELSTLQGELSKRLNSSFAWCSNAFGESFSAWVHVKVLRVFVESVLRYGLPINFVTVAVQPYKKTARTARKALQTLYQHLDASVGGRETQLVDVAGVGMNAEYHPYVTFTIDLTRFVSA